MNIREATEIDFDEIWPIYHEIASAGQTYTYPEDTTKEQALDIWLIPLLHGVTTIAILHICRPGRKLAERKQLTRLCRNINIQTGDYTRLTRFKSGADTTSFGS